MHAKSTPPRVHWAEYFIQMATEQSASYEQAEM